MTVFVPVGLAHTWTSMPSMSASFHNSAGPYVENTGDTNPGVSGDVQGERSAGFLSQPSTKEWCAYRFALPLPVRLVNTILTKTSGDT